MNAPNTANVTVKNTNAVICNGSGARPKNAYSTPMYAENDLKRSLKAHFRRLAQSRKLLQKLRFRHASSPLPSTLLRP